jgi:cobalt-zinc-cadmium resistance protein CzcA
VLTGVIEWSLANRAMVIALFVLMALGGLYATTQIPVDAVPDLVNVQVQVVTEAGSLPPLEVERSITYPVELAVSGLPDVEEIRSISRLGISLVTIGFREGTDILRARQLVAERLPAAKGGIAVVGADCGAALGPRRKAQGVRREGAGRGLVEVLAP